jgi:integrase
MRSGSGLARGKISLTHRGVEALRPSETAYRIADQRCIGLAVRVSPTGAKTWDLVFRIRGTSRIRRLSLGSTADVSLESARDRANALTSAGRAGRDLIAEEQTAQQEAARRYSVADLIDEYVRRRVIGRLKTAKEIEARLRRALASLMKRNADEIRRRDLREVFDRCAAQGIVREAEQRRQYVGAMFRWALSQDIVEIDPSNGLKPFEAGLPRTRVLDYQEIGVLWNWLDTHLPPSVADVLRLQLLTGARCGEISGMCAEEFDCNKWIWTLPPIRSKNSRARVTPILGIAKAIVERNLNQSPTGALFRSESGSVLTASHVGHYLIPANFRIPLPKFSTHDLRRTVATRIGGSWDAA